MLNEREVHWRCTNRDCGWSAVLSTEMPDAGGTVCVCGGRLERVMGARGSAYLDFLWDGETATVPGEAEEE